MPLRISLCYTTRYLRAMYLICQFIYHSGLMLRNRCVSRQGRPERSYMDTFMVDRCMLAVNIKQAGGVPTGLKSKSSWCVQLITKVHHKKKAFPGMPYRGTPETQ